MASATATFRKTEACPRSEDLLAFQKGKLEGEELEWIQNHLGRCEFCAAETALYLHFPPSEEAVPPEAMPEPLYELAEALLQKDRDLSPLYKLVDAG